MSGGSLADEIFAFFVSWWAETQGKTVWVSDIFECVIKNFNAVRRKFIVYNKMLLYILSHMLKETIYIKNSDVVISYNMFM